MERIMEFEVTAFDDNGREDRTWIQVNVTEAECTKMMKAAMRAGSLNEVGDLDALTERVQDAAENWVPFEDDEDSEMVLIPAEYDVAFPQEIMEEKRKEYSARRCQYRVKGIRFGYDGGGVGCGPIDGSILVEAVVLNGEGKLLFTSLSRFMEFAKVAVSQVPLFDLLMQLPDGDLNTEYEIGLIEKCTVESWEFENACMPAEMWSSDLCGIFKLLLQAENFCRSDERGEDFEGAQEFIAKYLNQDGNELMNLDFPDRR